MLIVAGLAVTLAWGFAQAPPTTWAGTAPGPQAVGVARLDTAGTVAAVVWRPVVSAMPPMSVEDLARLACDGPATEAAVTVVARCLGPTLVSTLDRRLYAGVGGRAVAARLPVVLVYGPLNSKGIELTSLAETLATHGYLVAAIAAPPVSGARAFDEASVQAARGAVRATLAALASDPGVDISRVALAAWSFGGVPLALEAQAHPGVRAFVSLDSALRYQYGADLIRSARTAHLETFRGALLSLSAGVDNAVAKDDRIIDGLIHARITRMVADGMSHADFADVPGALGMLTKPAAEQVAFRRRYGRTVARIVAFLTEVIPPAPAEASPLA